MRFDLICRRPERSVLRSPPPQKKRFYTKRPLFDAEKYFLAACLSWRVCSLPALKVPPLNGTAGELRCSSGSLLNIARVESY